jgi:hypothetical protein
MTEGDFGYHHLWVNLPFWVNHLDISRILAQAHSYPGTAPSG